MKGPQSKAQSDATMRNWGIRRLRGLHAQAGLLSGTRAYTVRQIIDDELREKGAETEADRRQRKWRELEETET